MNNLPAGVSKPTWVIIDLQGEFPAVHASPLAEMLGQQESLKGLAEKLDRLAQAPWLHGVLFRVGKLGGGYATASALRGMIARLGERKRTVVYTPTLGMRELLLGSAAQELVCPEGASLDLRGMSLEATYYGETLRRSGVHFENIHFKEYKSALMPFSQERMDAASREQLSALLRDLEAQWVRDVSLSRGLSTGQVQGWLDAPPTSAREARERGIVSRVAYDDELIGPATRPLAAVLGLLMSGLKLGRPTGRIGIVPVVGTIVDGRSRNNPLPLPLLGGPQAGDQTVVAALRQAAEDKTTAATVLWVDSGGGSALASDLIWREVSRSAKPVVAVMGNVAASGGYYVLTHAAKVLASPYTLTGSIGVVSGKPVLEEFNARHGIHPELLRTRELGGMESPSRPFDPQEREYVQRSMAEIYDRFVGKVAAGRELEFAQAEALARGRIWSGAAAQAHGLIDGFGSLGDALGEAARLAGLESGAPAYVVRPRPTRFPNLREEAQAPAAALASRQGPHLHWPGLRLH